MPVGPADIGINSAEPALLQNIEWEGAMSDTLKMSGDGTFGVANAFDPIITGSLTSLGLLETALGVGASGIAGVEDGVTVFHEKDHHQVQDDYDESTTNFDCAPGAATGAAG